ncbi:hypothetical protein Daesc_001484 [Daldinia eschscholtzii]|uniref:Uncharacterized protein n=1 Tax=Daldinia eschscholtzii TaxID=292717 RepID=A0AAX6MVK0_9PEZI
MDNFQVHVDDSSTSRVCSGPNFLSDLIQGDGEAERFVIHVGSNSYILFLTSTSYPYPEWEATDAVEFCRYTITKSKTYGVCIFSLADSKLMNEGSSAKCMVLSILKTTSHGAASVRDVQTFRFMKQSAPGLPGVGMNRISSCVGRRSCLVALLTILAVLVASAVAFLALHSAPYHSKEGIWERYNIEGSRGPRYQLQFDHHNVSEWEERYPNPNQEWFLRIDDQAMIPLDLVTDEELRYQHWFQERYSEANNIRLEGKYLQTAFLSDPDIIQVPVDKTFHMAHCVVALRRYWTARESKSHVCPRDIDYRHMKHCLDALDMWAFPEGPQHSLPLSGHDSSMHNHDGHKSRIRNNGYWIDESDDSRLIWKTKVCFD